MIAMIILVRCKKYPENIVLVVPPEVVLKELSGAKLKSYTVNGIDSMEAMEKAFPFARERVFNYGSYTTRSGSLYTNFSWNVGDKSFSILGLVIFSDDKKFFSGNGPFGILGINNKWKIIKLTKKELKVTAQKNNNIYEIYFAK